MLGGLRQGRERGKHVMMACKALLLFQTMAFAPGFVDSREFAMRRSCKKTVPAPEGGTGNFTWLLSSQGSR